MDTLAAGTRIRLVKNVENYPHVFAKEGETGTFLRIDEEGSHWFLLDRYEDGIDEWDNEVMIWDWSKENGTNNPDENPRTYYEAHESDALAAASADYGLWLDAQTPPLPHMSADELLHEIISDDQRRWLTSFSKHWERLQRGVIE